MKKATRRAHAANNLTRSNNFNGNYFDSVRMGNPGGIEHQQEPEYFNHAKKNEGIEYEPSPSWNRFLS